MRPDYNEDFNHEDDGSDAPSVCKCGQVIDPFTHIVDESTGQEICQDCADAMMREEHFQEELYYLTLMQEEYELQELLGE